MDAETLFVGAELNLRIEHTIRVSAAEFRLIGLALCGRLKPEQVGPAAELNRRLLQQKLHALNQHRRLVEGALASTREEMPPRGPELEDDRPLAMTPQE